MWGKSQVAQRYYFSIGLSCILYYPQHCPLRNLRTKSVADDIGMDTVPSFRGRARGAGGHEPNGRGRQSKNKTWVAGGSRSGTSTPNHNESDRWERGGHRGSRGRRTGRPRTFANASLVVTHPPNFENAMSGDEAE